MADRRRKKFSVYNTEEMQKRKRVVKKKYRKDRFIAIMTILFIIIYLSYSLINFLAREDITYVTAISDSITEKHTVKGVITRSEEIIKTNMSGYIEYLYIDGEKISKNSVIARVSDQNYSKIIDTKIDSLNNEILTSSDTLDANWYNQEMQGINLGIQTLLKGYVINKEYNMFEEVYEMSKELEGLLVERYETFIIENNKSLDGILLSKEGYEKQLQHTNQLIINEKSGIITYSYDSYENLNYQNINMDFIDNYQSAMTKISLEPHEISGETPIYKVITSQDWFVTILLDQPLEYKQNDTIEVIIDDEKPIKCEIIDYSIDELKATLSFDQRIHDYMNKRLVNVMIDEVDIEGIKIPYSCIMDTSLVGIPYDYVMKSNGVTGVLRRGIEDNEFVQIDIVYSDQEYVYIEENETQIKYNDLLIPDQKIMPNAEDYKVAYKIEIPSVYVVNKGYNEFRAVEVLYHNQEYAILANNTPYGVRVFDRVLLNNKE